jgi:metallo-beta-lactamase class B
MSSITGRRPHSAWTLTWIVLALLALPALPAGAQEDERSRSWNQPVEPFRIVGNLYYVGASDVTAFLLTTPKGHILLDGGFAETAPLIRDSIRKLGFRLEDVEILLSSHAHMDHAGGLAALKAWSGATFLASAGDVAMLVAGGKGDFRFGDSLTFPPIRPDRTLRDGETVRLGGTTLTARLTPGHTPGCTTWDTTIEDGGKRYRVVFVGSTTVNPGVNLTGMPGYPQIAADYQRTFAALEKLPADVFLASHGSFFDLAEKTAALRARKPGAANPFVDPEGYRSFVAATRKRFEDQLARDRAAQSKGGKARVPG